jgi:hypothetical protein
MNHTMTFSAQPSVDMKSGLLSIAETMSMPHLEDPTRQAYENFGAQVVDTKNAAVRAALIRLGWTPPPAGVSGKHGLSDVEPSLETRMRVRANDAASSVIAAEGAARFASSHKERILRAMREDELSSHQIAKLSGLTVVQVDRRLTELQRENEIELVMVGGEELLRAGYRVYRRIRSSQN